MHTYGVLMIGLLTLIAWGSALGVTVGNGQIQRELIVEDGRLSTTFITNAITGRRLAVTGEEFRFAVDERAPMSSHDFRVTRSDTSDESHASWTLESSAPGLRVAVKYDADKQGPYLRKTITVTNIGDQPRTIRWLDVDRVRIDGEKVEYSANPDLPALTDYGQPVLLDSVWLGLEYPAAHTAQGADDWITLRHYPGKVLEPGESLTSKTGILGAANEGQARPAFMQYVEDLKYYPGPPRFYFWLNAFRVIKPPDRLGQGLKMMDYMINELQRPYGHVFDAFSYDAGFAMYQETGLWNPSEPDIWTRTRKVLEGSTTDLGFWASFSCIYDTNTHEWGRTKGFGLQHPTAYCLAEPTYHAAAKKRLLDIVREHDMKVISFDGMHLGQGYGCGTPGHGHLVGNEENIGKYGTEAVVDAALDIYRSIREIQPDICIDFFVCGEWASPWWLTVVDGVHTVAGDTIGCDFPSPALRDELITARDLQAFDLHRRQKRPFPLWAEDLYGSQVRRDHLIDGVQAFNEDYTEKWENEYVLSLAGRGTITSYIACSDLPLLGQTPTGMKFFAEVAHWVRHHRAIYRHTSFILGDPNQGEVCGYAHGDRDGRSVIALHNPQIESRTVKLKIDGLLDLGRSDKRFTVNMIYPERMRLVDVKWNDEIELPVHGFEVILLDIRRERLAGPKFRAVEARELSRPEFEVSVAEGSEGRISIKGQGEIPTGHAGPELLIYLRPEQKLECGAEAAVNGEKADVTIRSRTRGGHSARHEAWFIVPLRTGGNDINLEITCDPKHQLGIWLRSSLPKVQDEVMDDASEPPFPTLPDGYRMQYWEVRAIR